MSPGDVGLIRILLPKRAPLVPWPFAISTFTDLCEPTERPMPPGRSPSYGRRGVREARAIVPTSPPSEKLSTPKVAVAPIFTKVEFEPHALRASPLNRPAERHRHFRSPTTDPAQSWRGALTASRASPTLRRRRIGRKASELAISDLPGELAERTRARVGPVVTRGRMSVCRVNSGRRASTKDRWTIPLQEESHEVLV